MVSAAVRARPVAQRAAFKAQIPTEVLRHDQNRSSVAGRLAPKKYGDHISHDVKGPGANFQPAILITVDGQPHDEFARQLAYDEDGGVLLDGNGDIVRER